MPTPENSPVSRETGKKRSVRIPLDYFRRTDRMTQAKAWLAVLAVFAALGWLSGLGWQARGREGMAERSRRLATHGPLARVHATWDLQCEACHVPFRPIDGQSWAAAFTSRTAKNATRCTDCHAGPAHHAAVRDEPGCVTCHRDHLGRDASLVERLDRQCTDCHGALGPHLKPDAKLTVAASVTRFDGDLTHHPEFKAVAIGNDPGTITFSHAVHLSYGMNPEPGGKPVWTWSDLAALDRGWYQGRLSTLQPVAKERPGVQLECASCHQLDAEDSGPPSGTADRLGGRSGGAYMLPIRYEVQCRACHALTYDSDLRLVMRDGLQPAEVHETLRRVYAERAIVRDPELAKWGKDLARPVPGQGNDPRREEARRTIDDQVKKAERTLFCAQVCGKCHVIPENGDDRRIEPASIPSIWFPQARFDHSAHRAVGCRSCHERAYPDAHPPSRSQADVLIPGAKQCAECHGPRRRDEGKVVGGADGHCTECHRYHHGDHPVQGKGALARDARFEFDAQQFLRGLPAGPK